VDEEVEVEVEEKEVGAWGGEVLAIFPP